MAKHNVSADWLGNMTFEGDICGHKIVVDNMKEHGGDDKGASPKRLMLLALAGCTGIDVVSILAKMRVELSDFKVSVEADVTEEHPKHYTAMHVIYEFRGKALPYDKIKRAVELSEERYCGVQAVYRKTMKITSEIRLSEIDKTG